ncbi:transglutaminase-like domain-containing protein [Hyalangium versicolor]|uniref:transglutaminase-like domain-containing protein n=1 Tax=Hyalangium versicolor TaxID=2861190 RepID=UPI001CCF39F6|nr:transglutaminase-like domain-containing protein [Hyalangium versicolor]
MNFKYIIPSNNYLKINGSEKSQAIAVQYLVRPNEVDQFITRTPSPFVPQYTRPFAEQVAEWLRSRLSSGKLSYEPDPNGPLDYWSAPSHTLAWSGGDCEDLTILGVSLFAAVGMAAQVTVGTYWNGSSSGGHAWIEGLDKRGFFLIEATTGDMYRRRPGNYLVTRWITPDLGRRVA